jgi:hypothetical protein
MLDNLVTYKDLVDYCLDYAGGDVTVENRRKARRAIQTAYRDMAKDHRWRYYLMIGRLNTVADYDTGTIAYDHTGGTYEREVTLTDGTWPSWAADGIIVIDNVTYEVEDRKSSTVITLKEFTNPGEDVAAEETYQLYKDTYRLPDDFQEAAEWIIADESKILQNISPQDFNSLLRAQWSPAAPWAYTYTGHQDYQGGMAVRFFPPPDDNYACNYLYKRYPRGMRIEEYKAGVVTTSSGSATITGSGGASFTSSMVGSVIRISSSTTEEPTGFDGGNPATFERIIKSYTSATSITLNESVDQTLTGVKYTISDPADIELGSMLTYLHRLIEKQMRRLMRMEPIEGEDREVMEAMRDALAADSRTFESRAAGMSINNFIRMADMPWLAGGA